MRFLVAALLLFTLSACAGYVEQQGCNGPLGGIYKCR